MTDPERRNKMDKISEIRARVAETGKMLLEKKLVARTWGNISERIDNETFAISPSGLDYLHTEPEDVAVVKLSDMTWEGRRKPSSEKGIHAAAYRIFPDVNFVIHTHQTYASALGLGGFSADLLTDEQKKRLGTIYTAGYGLPGTKKLAGNVSAAYELGAKIVFMEHHGVVICGKDRDDAFELANLLEEVCKAQLKGVDPKKTIAKQVAELGLPIPAQLDDMAQMIGSKIPVVENDPVAISEKLKKVSTVIVKGQGIQIACEDPDDREALEILAEKAAVSFLHTRSLGIKATLSAFDSCLMRIVYKFKYSKQKKG